MIVKIINQLVNITYKAVNTDYATAAAGRDVVITKAPEPTHDRVWVLDAIQYSYNPQGSGAELQAAPVRGGITITLGDKIKWDADIPDLTGVLSLYIPGQTDKTFTVTLRSGGNLVIGKLNCQWHLEPAAG